MPLIQTDSQHYSDIADAIRDMSGNEETFYPSEMAAGVRSIPQTIAIAPIIYSLEEREVGVWTDGKPLYEKTFNISSIGYTTIGVFITLASVPSNIQFVTKIEGVLYNSSNTMCYPLEHEAYDEKLCIIRYNRSENSIDFCSNDTWPNGRIIVTIQYTKTTDTPGSGTWTPSGVPAHHYSTEEQVIGTWIDGKPLYEKTIHYVNTISSFRDFVTIENIPNIKTITYLDGSVKRILDNNMALWYKLPSRVEESTGLNAGIRVQEGNIQYRVDGYGTTMSDLYITLQYTKTTD